MLMMKGSIKRNGVVDEYVGSVECVREWLCYWMEKGGFECGVFWEKEVVGEYDGVWGCDEIRWMCYWRGKVLVWEEWGKQKMIVWGE